MFNKPNVQYTQLTHKIVRPTNFSVQDTLPYLAKELDVPILIPCFGSEKYIICFLSFSMKKHNLFYLYIYLYILSFL